MLGKGIFVWTGSQIFNYNIGKFINYVADLKLDHIFMRIGAATNLAKASYPNMPVVINLLREQFPSMQIWGWHYTYCGSWMDKLGNIRYDNIASPENEADFAKQQIKLLQLDGYVIDAERELKFGYGSPEKAKNPYFRAQRFMNRLKGIGVPVGLSSYRFPDFHREFAWAAYLESPLVGYHMPQVYWGSYTNAPSLELMRSVAQLKAKKDLPFVPAGRAYIGDGHKDPKADEIRLFNQTVKKMNLDGCNYWSMDALLLHPNGALRALAIKEFDFDGVVTEVPPTQPEPQSYRVTGDYLRVRTGPGLDYGVKKHLRTGEKISVYEKQYKDYVWGRIDATNSLWCAINYATPM